MEHAYAQALWSAVEGGMTPHAAVKSLKELLERSGRAALIPKVVRAFARLAERESKKNDLVLTVARDIDERHARTEAREILEALEDSKDLKTQVDDSLIGGWRLEGKGMLIDNSHKNKLLGIYHRVTSA